MRALKNDQQGASALRIALRFASSLTLLVALQLAFAGAAYAQTRVVSANPQANGDSLLAQALELHERPSKYAEAARLHLRAVDQMSLDDPRAVSSLLTAAHLLGYGERTSVALDVMEKAAERALQIGDIYRAATAYASAAFLAKSLNCTSDVRRLAERAWLLSTSPLLSELQRKEILARLRTPRQVADNAG